MRQAIQRTFNRWRFSERLEGARGFACVTTILSRLLQQTYRNGGLLSKDILDKMQEGNNKVPTRVEKK